MKTAHKYKLEVTWNWRKKWEFTILAINAEVVSMWLPKQEPEDDFIINVSIQLLARDIEEVSDTFLAKGID